MITARPTIRDIAAELGCHYSTVSLALRHHPRIPAATRAEVHQVAARLGYRPDAMLAALAAYRSRDHRPAAPPVLAWITHHPTRDGWRDSACSVDYHAGARRRAIARGYRLEEFWLGAPGLTGRRLSQILHTRGIQGLLLPPQPQRGSLDLQWDRFSAVTFGYTLVHPRLHLVTNHEYRTMGALFASLQERGYQRIGLADLREHDARVDHNWLAAYLIEQKRLGSRLPPLILERWTDAALLAWVRRHRPDVIVTKLPEVLTCLRQNGIDVPGGIGVGFHSLDDHSTGLSGMRKNASAIGVIAVDQVIDMIHRHETGLPGLPQMLMVEGSWVEGDTLRPAAAISPAAAFPSSP